MIRIELLKQHPEAIPQLVKLWQELLGSIWVPGVSAEQAEARFHVHLNDDQLPLTFVALDDDRPVGMCSLRANDGIRPDLIPWLGSLIVDKQYQKQGIGKRLIDSVIAQAKQMKFETLYLFAFDKTIPDYYQHLGWKTIGMDVFKSHDVIVMSLVLL